MVESGDGEPEGAAMHLPRTENRVTTGNWITIAALVIAGSVAWGTVTSDLRALAQRVDAGEKRDHEVNAAVQTIKEKQIEMQADQKMIRKDLDMQSKTLERIERILDSVQKKSTP